MKFLPGGEMQSRFAERKGQGNQSLSTEPHFSSKGNAPRAAAGGNLCLAVEN
jgi:hypothetical protein